MPLLHRHGDSRICGASTISSGQSTVSAGGQLIAVVGDLNSHGAGAFTTPGSRTVSIGGKKVIIVGDDAQSDSAEHTPANTKASTGLGTVSIG